MKERLRKFSPFVTAAVALIVFLTVNLLKIVYISHSFLLPNPVRADVIYLVAIFSLSFLIPLPVSFRTRVILLALADLFISGLILADIGYRRFFAQLPPFEAIKFLPMLMKVKASVSEVIKPFEWGLLLSFAIYLPPLALERKLQEVLPQDKKSYLRLSLLAGSAAVIIMAGYTALAYSRIHSLPEWKRTQRLTLSKMGILGFHVNEVLEKITRTFILTPSYSEADLEFLEQVLSRHSLKPSRKYRELEGCCGGKNVIIILLESFQNFMVGKKIGEGVEITPTLNRLMRESFYFPRFYSHVGPGNTSDAEFSTNNGLYPLSDGSVYMSYFDRDFVSLPKLLLTKGYFTAAFHANKPDFWNRASAYPFQGILHFFSQADFKLTEKIGIGLSDEAFFNQVAEKLENLPKPFYALIITLTNHHPYKIPKHLINVDLEGLISNPLLKRYLQSVNYVDTSLGKFLDALEAKGLLDESIVVIFGDHFASAKGSQSDINSIFHEKLNYISPQNVPLFIRLPGGTPSEVINKVGGHKDIYPTLLYLLGYYEEGLPIIGDNLLSEEEGCVAWKFYLSGSWICDNTVFLSPYKSCQELTPSGHYREAPLRKCRQIQKRLMDDIIASEMLIKGNLFSQVFPKVKKMSK